MLNFKAAAAAPAAAPTASKKDDAPEPQATKTNFTVKLLKFDDSKKIALIKEIKALNPGSYDSLIFSATT